VVIGILISEFLIFSSFAFLSVLAFMTASKLLHFIPHVSMAPILFLVSYCSEDKLPLTHLSSIGCEQKVDMESPSGENNPPFLCCIIAFPAGFMMQAEWSAMVPLSFEI